MEPRKEMDDPRQRWGAEQPPVSRKNTSGMSGPISVTFAYLKGAWPFALVGFVIGFLAASIVNKRKQRVGVTSRAQLHAAGNTPQNLEAGKVGFVSNRVPLAKSDLAFRRSLHDMEQHLPNEVASSSMWTVNWHGIIEDSARKPEPSAGENLSSAQSQPAPAAPAFDRTDTFFKRPIEETSKPGSAQPKLFISQLQPEPVPACASTGARAEYPASTPSKIQLPNLPDWFWEGGGSSGSRDFAHLSIAKETEPGSEQMLPDAASRMERLRNLFANVGLGNLHRNRDPLSQHESMEPRPLNPQAPSLKTAEKPGEQASTTGVETRPKTLLPREFIPLKEPKHASDVAAFANLDDEIRILPSKRGQYGSR
jgi:hypothetical protein